MENVTATYDANELAWVTPILTLRRDIFLRITLKEKGKVVIRQSDDKGNFPRVPIPSKFKYSLLQNQKK